MDDFENLLLDGWEDEGYLAFVDKFKTKKTTDDCYTPPAIYEVVAAWVADRYRIDRRSFVRPFYPGGDYKRHEYPPQCTVVDNPPFSIISEIVRFYSMRGIRFFLFAPALTLFSRAAAECCTALPLGVPVTYENGAEVPTSFLTNLESEDIRVRTAPDLYRLVDEKSRALQKSGKTDLRKYVYPDHILTAAIAQRWCKYGVEYTLRRQDSMRISGLEAQKTKGDSIFGGGFLLSTRAAAERAAAERSAAERAAAERAAAERWDLRESELLYIDYMDRRLGDAGTG